MVSGYHSGDSVVGRCDWVVGRSDWVVGRSDLAVGGVTGKWVVEIE